MPIIKNNLYYEVTSETVTKPVSAVKIQLDILNTCVHDCPGCYVDKKNNFIAAEDIRDISNFIKGIVECGILVDEILIGPTDFSSSANLVELLSNTDFIDLINDNGPILAFTSSFVNLNEVNFRKFCSFVNDKITNNTEIEMGIAIDPKKFLFDSDYNTEIKKNIEYLNILENSVTYTFLVNIDDYEIEFVSIFEKAYSEYDTTIDFIPSIARSGDKEKLLRAIQSLNEFYDKVGQSRVINNIMVDHSHGGMNYQVVNWRKSTPYKPGKWYLSPFLYENMAIYDEFWEIKEFSDITVKVESQLNTDTECNGCEFFFSCYNRKIQLLQDYIGTTECIVSKDNLMLHKDTSLGCADSMYQWDGYTNEKDRNGYRDKFLVHENNLHEIEKIEEIYNANK